MWRLNITFYSTRAMELSRIQSPEKTTTPLLFFEGALLFFLVFTFVLYGHQGEYFLNFLRIGIAGAYGTVLFFCRKQTRIMLYRQVVLVALTVLLVVVPVIGGIQERYKENTILEYHDGAYQSEMAFDMLLHGKNPYSESFESEEFKEAYSKIKILDAQEMSNPAVESYVYLPATFLITGVFGYVEHALFGFQDVRILLLLIYLLFMFFVWRMLHNVQLGIVLYILLVFNPYNLFYLAQGRNDTFILALIFFVLYFLRNRAYVFSSIILGILVAFKQSAWIVAPLVISYLAAGELGEQKVKLLRALKSAIIIFCIAICIIAPFFLWAPSDMIQDILMYPSAGGDTGYPINGYGFSPTLLNFELTPTTAFPFFLLMALPAVGFFIYGVREVYQRPSRWSLLLISGFFSFWVFLFSRYFNDSHIAFVFSLFLLGAAFYLQKENE